MISINPMAASDWETVRSIYEDGIATGNATFQISAPSWKEWDQTHLQKPRLVASLKEQVVGWAALSPVSGRCVYSGVAEVSVYVSKEARGEGIGTMLLTELIEESEQQGIWTLQAGIFPENEASINLHKRCGFRVVGLREKLGKLDGTWRDVLLMERRSSLAGVEENQ